MRATVTGSGAVLLGDHVCADGFAARRKVRVVTHAHSDHTLDIGKSLSYQSYVLMTPETFVFLKHLKSLKPNRKIKLMNPGESFKVPLNNKRGGYEKITFIKATHIPGSVQVLVEDDEGNLFGYTGDFKEPGSRTPIMKDLDALVVDVTYGCSMCRRTYKGIMEEELARLVQHLLAEGPVHIYAYHGKIQEVMELLRLYGIDAPFLVDRRTYGILKDLEDLGYRFGEYFRVGDAEGAEVERAGWYVRFAHFNKFGRERVAGNKVVLDGWRFVLSQKVGPNAWRVGFSDHADLDDTEYYILEAKPKEVVLDAFRSSTASWFAQRLTFYGRTAVTYRPLQRM
ncbi:MAG: hypothetical protein GXO07_05210 [Crenarchaeota archaeon]|nr:hypothetical protein [Thermoproteota archaeon]